MTQKEIEDGNRLIAEFMNVVEWYDDENSSCDIENGEFPPYNESNPQPQTG